MILVELMALSMYSETKRDQFYWNQHTMIMLAFWICSVNYLGIEFLGSNAKVYLNIMSCVTLSQGDGINTTQKKKDASKILSMYIQGQGIFY